MAAVPPPPPPPPAAAALPPFETGLSCYSLKFSPYDNKLAVACSQHFGIVGNGRQLVLDVGPQGLTFNTAFDTQDGLFDCTWSESNERHLISSSGDGSIKLWDVGLPPPQNPLRSFHEHTHEAYSVDWNMVAKDTFVSGAWDNTVKFWSPERHESIRTWKEHSYCVYSTMWSPTSATLFASASGDGTLRLWDVNEPSAALVIPGHGGMEVLTCDWSKYNENIIVSGSVDKSIRVWDIRKPLAPLFVLQGHTYAVRRLKCSPYHENMIASVSYDMTMILWDYGRLEDPFVQRYAHHTEFALGVDFNIFVEGQVATCAWDERVFVFDQNMGPAPAI
jgi:peroxin-7